MTTDHKLHVVSVLAGVYVLTWLAIASSLPPPAQPSPAPPAQPPPVAPQAVAPQVVAPKQVAAQAARGAAPSPPGRARVSSPRVPARAATRRRVRTRSS